MKKKMFFLGLMFIVLSAFVFEVEFFTENTKNFDSIYNIGQKEDAAKVVISYGNMGPRQLFEIIKIYLKKYNGNIYFKKISIDKKTKKTTYKKYIFFTDSRYFNNLRLSSGRFFHEAENDSELFLSTTKTGDEKQIGVIADFAGNDNLEIRTIESELDKIGTNLFDRYAIIQLSDGSKIDDFIKELSKNGIYIQKIEEKSSGKMGDTGDTALIITLMGIVFFISILLVYYDILNSYKKIAVEKMLGYEKKDIWIKRIIPIVIIEISSMMAVDIFFSIYNFKTYNIYFRMFLFRILAIDGIILFLTVIILAIPFAHIKKIYISSILKNRTASNPIINFNLVVKTVLTIVMIVLTSYMYIRYQLISNQMASLYKDWVKTKDLAVITDFAIRPGVRYDSFTEKNKEIERKLYSYFNKRGAVYANFQDFLPENQEDLTETQRIYYKNMIKVNPNYLKRHKILDEKGKRVKIDENESDYILLVPEKYRADEKKIREYNTLTAYKLKNKNIKIIWIKTGQRFFSYRLDINPKEGNCITDPIARVITESNADLLEYCVIIAYSGHPFKFKINDPSNASAEVLAEINKYYKASDFIIKVSTVYDNVKEQIQNIKRQLFSLGLLLLILFAVTSIILIQNVITYFEQYKLKIAIQRFHGYTLIDKYKDYLLRLVLSWIIIVAISFAITKNNISLIILVLSMLEFIISLIVISYMEKRKVLKVTKGG